MTSTSILAAAAMLGLLVMTSPAAAQTASLDTDIKCLVATGYLTANGDAQAKSAGVLGAAYFMGRAEIQIPDRQALETRMAETAKAMTRAEILAFLVDVCNPALNAAGQKLTSISTSLQAARVKAKP